MMRYRLHVLFLTCFFFAADGLVLGLLGGALPARATDCYLGAVALAWILTQVSLLTVWACGAAQPSALTRGQVLLIDLPVLGMLASSRPAISAGAVAWISYPASAPLATVEFSVLLLLQAAIVATPFLARRWLGGPLTLAALGVRRSRGTATYARTQFTLREFFLCTATLAFLLGILKLGWPTHWQPVFAGAMRATPAVAWLAVGALAAVWATFGTDGLARHLALLLVFAPVGVVLLALWHGDRTALDGPGALGVAQSILLLPMLVALRLLGWRLQLTQPTGRAP